MPIDYLAAFPIPAESLPQRLCELLGPVGIDPDAQVGVAQRFEADPHGSGREYVHYVMAVVPEADVDGLGLLREAWDGLVETSTPDIREKGGLVTRHPSVSGHDYVVAAWGDHSWFAFNLAESVWMTLGLSPRCVGNDSQRIVYDDLTLPEFGIAEGEVTTEYYWRSKRDIRWRMRNDYLRRYLWMRGAWGVRCLYYEAALPDLPVYRGLMGGQLHARIAPQGGWFDLDIREWKDGLLLKVAACVAVVSPDLCAEPSAEGLTWPGFDGPMTSDRASALLGYEMVHLDDRFLERYEQNAAYDSTPVHAWDRWQCSPSYAGQWSFSECVRVGRNMVRVPMRELYKPKPGREILHAHRHVLRLEQVANLDPDEEAIVAKVKRLVDQLLALAQGLSRLSRAVGGVDLAPDEIFGFSAQELRANGWHDYPAIRRLAQVAPLSMTQQAFLARCKGLHELWQRLPNGFVRRLLLAAGYSRADVKDLGSLKLLQGLLNVLEKLNEEQETVDAFGSGAEPGGLQKRNPALAALFLTHDLRIADAHETGGQVREALQALGLDVAELNAGYGRALDLVFNGAIGAFNMLNRELAAFQNR